MPSSKQDENRLEADDLPIEAEFVVEPEDKEDLSAEEVKSGGHRARRDNGPCAHHGIGPVSR